MADLEQIAKQIADLTPGVTQSVAPIPSEPVRSLGGIPMSLSDTQIELEPEPEPELEPELKSEPEPEPEPLIELLTMAIPELKSLREWSVSDCEESLKKYADKNPTLYLYGGARNMIPEGKRWPYDGNMAATPRQFLRGSNINRFPANVLGKKFPTSGVFSAEICNGFPMNTPEEIKKGFETINHHRDWPLVAIGSEFRIEEL